MPDRVSITGYNFENDYNYTPVKVKDKDTGKTFVVQMVNAKIKGNKAEWTIKDGKVYDANGKTVKDNILEVTRYQAQFIKTAAAAGENANSAKLNEYDLVGAGFANLLEKNLQASKSEYHVKEADALEHGVIFADMQNEKGEKGHMEISFIKDPPAPQEKKFSIWHPSTWF